MGDHACRCPSFLHGISKITWCVTTLAVLLFVVGIALFGFSWLIEREIEVFVKDGIYQTVVVDAFVSITGHSGVF